MVRHALYVAVAAASGLVVAASGATPARAAVTLYAYESGADVVVTGSGTINLAGLSFVSTGVSNKGVQPSTGFFIIGATNVDAYSGFAGPSDLGPSGAFTPATSVSGDALGLYYDIGRMTVPAGYISGASLSSTALFANKTLASLGLTEGTYVYNWGSGGNADSMTILITQAIPEASAFLFGGAVAGAFGVAAFNRRRSGFAVRSGR